MAEGYTSIDWSVYVGWKNPIISGSFDPSLVSSIDVIDVNDTGAIYMLHVKDWPGFAGDEIFNGVNQFYLVSSVSYIIK